MNLREVLRQTFATLRAHRMRSFLTMFGVIWGIASVILLVGLGKGFSKDQKERMKTLGKDLVIVWGGRTSMQAGGLAAGRLIRLTVDDARLVRSECYRVRAVSPELASNLPEVSAFNSANRRISGVWPAYQDFRSLELEEGRLMTQEDEDVPNRVVVLGAEAARQLYPGQPAIGATLLIRSVPYTVIGVLAKKKQNSNYSGPDNDKLFIPYSAMARDFPPVAQPNEAEPPAGFINDMVFEVKDPQEHEEAVMQVRAALGRLHHFDPHDKDALFIWDTMDFAKILDRIFEMMTIFFGAVAVVTLCLGGIGVMNIMLVAVTERTREIGVRKALGATAGDIQRQFFAESATISLISGALGLAVGIGICLSLAAAPLPDFVPHPVISPVSLITSVLTLAFITMTAGTYPARRAAEMTPVECLRYE